MNKQLEAKRMAAFRKIMEGVKELGWVFAVPDDIPLGPEGRCDCIILGTKDALDLFVIPLTEIRDERT